MELVHLHRCLRHHHMEDGKRTIFQGLALILHLAEAALQVYHLAANGVQLLFQHCGQKR